MYSGFMNRPGITDRKGWLLFNKHMHLAIGHLEHEPLAIYYGPSMVLR